ncbi:ribosome maturation factor RimM [Sandarakinorhabdus sp. AAP62]|uniref:ribosome maturation factor RimM n=1 Tax=Sandarakinorhabdus sp. AAP62 TaxID=1248916 RepID=UPI00030D6FCB|nr:ribosome maturation factor RimM [Sandarakinorhabdus sp. AAP62]
MAADQIVLAAIAGAHGIRGEVRLKLFTDDAQSLARHARFDAGGRALVLAAIRADKPGTAIARFEGVTDRNLAEAMRGLTLSVSRAALPPLAEGEYYVADYLGRTVVDETGEVVGTVKSIDNFGASDIIDIALARGGTVMVPFLAHVVREEADRLIVDKAWLQ